MPPKKGKNIISASRRTDIPAYYMPWFMNRLKEGFAEYFNPFFKQSPIRVSLKPDDVLAFVFWSKNFAPFIRYAGQINELKRPIILHYTINSYPSQLEPHVPHKLEHHIQTAKMLASMFGRQSLLVRYDPVLFTSITPPNWHIQNFEKIVTALSPYTKRIHTSIISPYRKTMRNLNAAANQHDFSILEIDIEETLNVFREMKQIAVSFGIELVSCSSPLLGKAGIAPGACIDGNLLAKLGVNEDEIPQRQPTRQGCLCTHARDIGAYETCVSGCVYCYAVNSHTQAAKNRKQHNPMLPYLA